MNRDCEITLIRKQALGQNAVGVFLFDTTYRKVFAQRKSVKQSEFYAAAQAGLKPALLFSMLVAEYHGEEQLEYDGVAYKIIRTYQKGIDTIELTCEKVAGV